LNVPHYKDGSEAKVGDTVTGKTHGSGGKEVAGVLVGITPGATSCNGRVARAVVGGLTGYHYAQPCLVHQERWDAEPVYLFTVCDQANLADLRKVELAT
jgi:hypothetical protein